VNHAISYPVDADVRPTILIITDRNIQALNYDVVVHVFPPCHEGADGTSPNEIPLTTRPLLDRMNGRGQPILQIVEHRLAQGRCDFCRVCSHQCPCVISGCELVDTVPAVKHQHVDGRAPVGVRLNMIGTPSHLEPRANVPEMKMPPTPFKSPAASAFLPRFSGRTEIMFALLAKRYSLGSPTAPSDLSASAAEHALVG
jgi:hypothetical protein